MPQTDGYYRTSDMHYAAYLRVAQIPFVDTTTEIDDRGMERVVFLFETPEGVVIRDLKRQFFSGRAKVSALEYAQTLRTMKTLTHMD